MSLRILLNPLRIWLIAEGEMCINIIKCFFSEFNKSGFWTSVSVGIKVIWGFIFRFSVLNIYNSVHFEMSREDLSV